MGPGNVGLGLFAQLQKFQVKCQKRLKNRPKWCQFFFHQSLFPLVNNGQNWCQKFCTFFFALTDPSGGVCKISHSGKKILLDVGERDKDYFLIEYSPLPESLDPVYPAAHGGPQGYPH